MRTAFKIGTLKKYFKGPFSHKMLSTVGTYCSVYTTHVLSNL